MPSTVGVGTEHLDYMRAVEMCAWYQTAEMEYHIQQQLEATAVEHRQLAGDRP